MNRFRGEGTLSIVGHPEGNSWPEQLCQQHGFLEHSHAVKIIMNDFDTHAVITSQKQVTLNSPRSVAAGTDAAYLL